MQILLLRLILQVLASINTNQSTHIERRIAGGEVAKPFKNQWISLIINNDTPICGGVLINPTTMITAAHCANGITIHPLLRVYARKERIYTFRAFERGFRFQVTRIIRHPLYQPTSLNFDIAVWKIKLVAGRRSALPINLVTLDDGTYTKPGQILNIAGWGSVVSNGRLSHRMRSTNVTIINDTNCLAFYSEYDHTSLCAGGHGRDTCRGDSGGPLFVSRPDGSATLVGIVSYGIGCGINGMPSVYSRISALSDWIKNYF